MTRRSEPPVDQESYRISREDFLRYIEIDLWNRFQRRLWSLVAITLSIAALAGLLGIPYYIRSQIERQFEEQRERLKTRSDDVIATSVAIAWRNAQSNRSRADLHSHVTTLQGIIQPLLMVSSDAAWILSDRLSVVNVADRVALVSALNEWKPDEHLLAVRFAPEVVPGVGSNSKLFYVPHPVLDGTVEGAVKDLRFRLVELAAWEQAMAALEAHLGHLYPNPDHSASATVDDLPPSQFERAYNENRLKLAKQLLLKSDRDKWLAAESYYSVLRGR